MSTDSTMQVADQVIDEAASLAQEEDTYCHDERRQHARHEYRTKAVIILFDGSGQPTAPMIVDTADISSGGLGVINRTVMRPGSAGVVILKKSTGTPTALGIEVRHCVYEGKMQHRTGLRFTPLPKEFRVDQLLSQREVQDMVKQLLAHTNEVGEQEATGTSESVVPQQSE